MRTFIFLSAAALTPSLHADVTLLATISVPPEATDLSGLTDTIGGDVPHNRLGGFGSAIERLKDHEYLILPDRGPRDGGTAYRCRFHLATIAPDSADPAAGWTFTLTKTVMLRDEHGRPFIGSSGAYRPSGPSDGSSDMRLDPEGVRVASDGTIWIADEYGPNLLAFSPEGTLQRRYPVPARYHPAVRDGLEAGELPPLNTKGRQPNRGFEGLALTPSGSLLAFLQGPLLQDGALDEANERIGRFLRVLNIPTDPAAKPVEWIYPLRSPQFSTNELLAIDDHRFLAIERDNKAGDQAKSKRITLVDFTNASDASGVDELPSLKPPPDLAPGIVTTLIDLLDERFNLNTAALPIPAKIEGLTFGPDLPDGRRTLLVTTDNDFKPNEPSLIWIFAIDRADFAPSAAAKP
jgi:hypothetical protein